MEFLLFVFTLDLSGLLQKFLLECSSLSSEIEFITVRVCSRYLFSGEHNGKQGTPLLLVFMYRM